MPTEIVCPAGGGSYQASLLDILEHGGNGFPGRKGEGGINWTAAGRRRESALARSRHPFE